MLELNDAVLESVAGGRRGGNTYNKVVLVIKNFTIKDHGELNIEIKF